MDNTDDNIESVLIPSNKGIVRPKNISTLYEYYISGTITSPEDYIHIFDQIRHAREDDDVKIYINSYGGDMSTAIQFMRVLSETNATVTCSVEGMCASAATLIFLSAHIFEITPHSSFMVHTFSGGTYGKGVEQYAQVNHERKWSEKLFKEVYEDFLTPSEINEILAGRDLWMDVDEVAARMNKRIATRRELAELEEKNKTRLVG
jgi:ATP-dependent protease ClpP protease subunit